MFEEFFKWKDLFDFSNYSKDSEFFNETNKNVIGKMNLVELLYEYEFGGIIVSEFVGPKPKIDSIKKLMVKNIQQKEWILQLNLMNIKMFYLIKKLLDPKWKEFKVKNKLGTYEIDKISLSCFDEKRYMLDDGIYYYYYYYYYCEIIKKLWLLKKIVIR